MLYRCQSWRCSAVATWHLGSITLGVDVAGVTGPNFQIPTPVILIIWSRISFSALLPVWGAYEFWPPPRHQNSWNFPNLNLTSMIMSMITLLSAWSTSWLSQQIYIRSSVETTDCMVDTHCWIACTWKTLVFYPSGILQSSMSPLKQLPAPVHVARHKPSVKTAVAVSVIRKLQSSDLCPISGMLKTDCFSKEN